MKACGSCKQSKPFSEFSKNSRSRDHLGYICRKCAQEKWFEWKEINRDKILKSSRKYYYENREKRIAATQKWYVENKEVILQKAKERRIKYVFNITLEEKFAMRKAQNNQCLICQEEFKSDKTCHVDHDHKTGKIRGLICNYCNTVLGYARDNVRVLTNAIAYLRKHSMISDTELIVDVPK